MSISSPSSRTAVPVSNDAVDSRRIGAANQTSLAFIGGHQPSWMLSGASPATAPAVLSKGPTRVRKRKSLPISHSKNLSMRPSSDTAGVIFQAQEQPTQGSMEDAENRNPGVNNGDAPPSSVPLASVSMDSNMSTSTSPQATPNHPSPPKQTGMRAEHLSRHDATQGSPTSNELTRTAEMAQQQYHGQHPSHPTSESHTPLVNRPRPPQNFGNCHQPGEPLPQQITFGGFVYQLLDASTPVLPSTPCYTHTASQAHFVHAAPNGGHPSNQYSSQDIRMARDHMVVWQQALIEFMNKPGSPGGNPRTLEAWRCSVMIDACKSNDVFCLALHQLYCLWSVDQRALHLMLPAGSHIFAAAFELLATIMKPNTLIHPQYLLWFSRFPFNLADPGRMYPYFKETSTQIVRFLSSLAHKWPAILGSVRQRRYPVLVSELITELSCDSTWLQIMLFSFSWRTFGPGDAHVAQEFANALQADKAHEMQAAMQPPNWGHLRQVRENIKQRYIAITSRLISQSNNTVARFTAAQALSGPTASANQGHNTATAAPVSPIPFDEAVPSAGTSSHASWSSLAKPVRQHHLDTQHILPSTLAGMSQAPQNASLGTRFSVTPLGEAEYPQNPYDWTSVRSGLHLARSRSPERVSAGGNRSRARYYQFLDRFAVEPTVLIRQKGIIQRLEFAVSATEFAERSQSIYSKQCTIHQYRQGALRYRLKLSGKRPENAATSMADWAISPCTWPAEIYININDDPVFPRRPQHFHQHLPIELTDTIKPGINTVKISLPENVDNYRRISTYYLAVEIIKTMDHESTSAMVLDLEAFSAEQMKSEIKRRIQPSDSESNDVVAQDESLSISLTDPFSACMIESPVRGMRCKHLECFDLEIWLQTRRGKQSQSRTEPSVADGWKCPICGEYAGPRCLRKDEYLLSVRQGLAQAGKSWIKSIKVTVDGNWTANEVPMDIDGQGEDATGERQMKVEPDVIEILDD